MSDERDRRSEERHPPEDGARPVPEADALEQASELDPDEDEAPSIADDVPEADALEQARGLPADDDERR